VNCRLRVAIDASPWRAGGGGMSRYVEQLVAHTSAAKVGWFLLTNRPGELPLWPENAALVRGPAVRPTVLWQLRTTPRIISALPADLAHYTTGRAPRSCSVPFVLTVHDLTPLDHPEWYPWRERLLVSRWLGGSIERAAAIIAVSESTRAAIARRFPGVADRVRVIHEAAAPIFHAPPDPVRIRALRARYGLGPRVWLHVGSLARRKNVPWLVEAYTACIRRGLAEPPQLVLAGGGGADELRVAARVRQLGLGGLVREIGRVPDTDLPDLYAAAELVALPSLHEGFGLAVVEAMASGAPVLTSRGGGLAEVAGDAAWMVDPTSVGDIAAGLYRLAEDPELRARLAAKGRAQARRFSWARAARETVAVYGAVARAAD